MKSSNEYIERIKSLRPNVYIDGELVSRDSPLLQPGMNVIALTYDMANDPQYDDILTARSHVKDEKVNRFCHIHQSPEDLLRKQEMTRLTCHKSGGCIQRCMGIDALNALSVTTYDVDQAKGTEYNQRFLEFLEYFQESDLCGSCAQTDVKGDRGKRPHQQADPDLYLRVVEKKKDGIVVRGAKAYTTNASYADEIIALPTRLLSDAESDWAVAFSVPADTKGLKLVTRPNAFRSHKQLQAPIANYGVAESLVIFDDVFVPWERVFLCGEVEFGGPLALLFGLYHRHSYTGCKPASTDVLLGMAALAAEYNGIEQAKHVQQKLAELIGVAELVYAAGVAAAVKGRKAPSGTYMPDIVYSNVGRRHAGENIYHEYEIVTEIAGGLPATLPLEGDFLSEETGPLVRKYLMRNPQISAEDQYRCFRLISDTTCSAMGGWQQIAGVHGGGSPIMETITILSNYDIEARKAIAKYLAGIDQGGPQNET